jgi:hypothetical protein
VHEELGDLPRLRDAACRNVGAVRGPLHLPDDLVGEERRRSPTVRVSGSRIDFLSLVSPKRRFASPEHDRVDHQPQLVDQLVLDR